ncbi:tRNA-uridine aminocarboxypropyltransferase [Pseudohongiella nitratireducens]|uniref:tRNA-uridine aminocarboxypropyltransferase n=1 Tax=Pseudohongiella nitratireducens TaxID=1768907 RepID=UPI0030EDC7B0
MPRARCPECYLAESRCLCHLVHLVDNELPVIVLQDPRESRHALNTVNIARLGLKNCTVLPIKPGEIDSGHELLMTSLPDNAALIYPGDNAEVVASCGSAKVNGNAMVFIDATWRRSKRMIMEQPVLQALPRFELGQVPCPRYTLRKSPAGNALSTLEAIVETLSCLDSPRFDQYRRLLAAMDYMIDYQAMGMGPITYIKNYR